MLTVDADMSAIREFRRAFFPGVALASSGKPLLRTRFSRHDLRVLIRQTESARFFQQGWRLKHLASAPRLPLPHVPAEPAHP